MASNKFTKERMEPSKKREKMKNDLNSVIQKLTSEGYNISHVFDIGANKGQWTAQYEQKLQNAQFFLFEANPNHQRPPRLQPKHKWFNAALSNPETTEVDFYSISDVKRRGTGDSYYKEQTHIYEKCVPLKLVTTTLDIIVKKYSLPFPQLMKLDTQGSELDILAGAKATIKHTDIIVTEVAVSPYNRGAPTFNDYIKFLVDLEYVPIGLEQIHTVDNTLVQVDVVFLKQHIKAKYYGNNDKLI